MNILSLQDELLPAAGRFAVLREGMGAGEYHQGARPRAALRTGQTPSCGFISFLMRLVLTVLAIVGLLVSPVTASAARAHCDHTVVVNAMADMPGMAHVGGAIKGAHKPCCDPHGRATDKACAEQCASLIVAMCAMPCDFSHAVFMDPLMKSPIWPTIGARDHKLSGPERPPKNFV